MLFENLTTVGSVQSVNACEIKESRLGIGFEKLDRALFHPENAYDPVAALGVKWIRLQSGWARTEKELGKYDFAWLDEIVDQLLERKLRPWLCLCYGNNLYTTAAKDVFMATGCAPVKTQNEREAWKRYVNAVAKHYCGRISHFEVWNEPDGSLSWKSGPDGKEYGQMVLDTVEAVRSAQPNAYMIAGSCFSWDLSWYNKFLCTGAAKVINAISYHGYNTDERMNSYRVRAIRSLTARYNPTLEFIQGETGAQSRSDGCGAHSGAAWTPRRQANKMLRHTINDFSCDVKFSSYFSAVDMAEALDPKNAIVEKRNDFGYFGLLQSEFDEKGIAKNYTPKLSYHVMQVVAAIFQGEFTVSNLPILPHSMGSQRILRNEDSCVDLTLHGFQRQNGAALLAYWKPTELLTTQYEATISFEIAQLPQPARLVDPFSGTIYQIPDSMIKNSGDNNFLFKNLPLTEYPLFLIFGDFA
ncbi:MAG: beta-galactosidase [Lentisphaeria bacterium]